MGWPSAAILIIGITPKGARNVPPTTCWRRAATAPPSRPHHAASPQVWMLNGATYEGYRSYIRRVKDRGFPAPPEPAPDGMELARLPTTQSADEEVRRGPAGWPLRLVCMGGGTLQSWGCSMRRPAAATRMDFHAAAGVVAMLEHELHPPAWRFPVQEPSTPQHADQQRSQQPSAADGPASAAAVQQGQLRQDAQAGDCLPAYSLCAVFDVANCPVSIVKFARGSADLLAWGDGSGVVYVATAEQPPRLLQVR